MPLPLVRIAALVLAFGLAGCTTHASHTPAPAPPLLLLVSIDGARADYLQRGLTPHLDQMAREGATADWLVPSYPALTFPNHYTLVTGLRPDHHGIINNTMRDPQLGRFTASDPIAVGASGWWGGEPIWVAAKRAGMRTATMFWPGSEAEIDGVRPDHWFHFDKKASVGQRVDQVFAWLDAPASRRPQLITLYFDQVDEAGHDHGPDSKEVDAALREVDAGIGRLRARIAATSARMPVNLIVVSDHGMAPTATDRVIAVESLADPALVDAIAPGQVVGFIPHAGAETAVADALLRTREHVQCWRKQDMPARWHYGSNPRVPPFVCQADEGWLLLTRAEIEKRAARHWTVGGAHGYDPALPSMRAIFIASGPAFRRGARVPAFDNVDVYPLLARLLNVQAAPNDGDPATLLPVLTTPSETTPAH